MGARTDFVRALLIGIIVGAAITTAFFQLRGGDDLSVEVDLLKARIKELESAAADRGKLQ